MRAIPFSVLSSSVRSHGVLAGVLLLPAVLGTLAVWSLGDRVDEVDQVRAAVVNLDKPVLGKNPVAAGRLLAAGLTSPKEEADAPLDWQLTDREDAAAGLRSGEYHAVLTIPKDFSRTVSRSLKGKDPERATISVATAEGGSRLVDQVSAQVARVSTDRLGEEVTTKYLETMFAQTGQLAGKLGKAADGAGRLADGTQRLGEGTREFAGGLDRLADGGEQLAGGAGKLADGARELARGTEELAGGTKRLAGGLGTLERETDPLPRQTRKLADGAGQVAEGVEGYGTLLKGWNRACANPLIAAQAAQLCVGTQKAVGPGGSTANQLTRGAEQVAGRTDQLASGLAELTRGIDRVARGAERLAGGAQKLARGTGTLVTGTERLAGGAQQMADGADEASTGAVELASGSERLGDGSRELASGLDEGADQIPSYGDEERRELADVIAAPVAAGSSATVDADGGRTELAPAAIALVLWLGAFATYLVRPALPRRLLGSARPASGVAAFGLLPGLVLGVLQAVLLFLAMRAVGAEIADAGATFALMALAAGSFAAVHQGLLAVLGRRRGWLGSLLLLGVQAVALGGLVPVDAAPWPVRLLNTVLPMPSFADGLQATALAGPESVAGAVAVLVVWALLGFALAVTGARRAQQVDLDVLRAEVEEREPQPVG